MKKEIYRAIAARLKSPDLGVKFVSLWNRNTEQLTKQRAFRLPAVFVEFAPIMWSQLGRGARTAEVSVRLHIVTETIASAEEGGKYQDVALDRLDIAERISTAMQGLAGDGINRFAAVESITDHDHDRIHHDQECFVVRVADTSAVKSPAEITGVKLVLN